MLEADLLTLLHANVQLTGVRLILSLTVMSYTLHNNDLFNFALHISQGTGR